MRTPLPCLILGIALLFSVSIFAEPPSPAPTPCTAPSGKIARAVRFDNKDFVDTTGGLFLPVAMLAGGDIVKGMNGEGPMPSTIDGVSVGILTKKDATWLLFYGEREKVEQLAAAFEQAAK